MIRNAITYEGDLKNLVTDYERQVKNNPNPKYWEDPEVNVLRSTIKKHYLQEQKNKCCYCGIPHPSNHGRQWDVEHVVPKATRPDFLFHPKNLAVSCIDCNMKKGDKEVLKNSSIVKYPKKSDAFLLVHPHYDEMDDHIAVYLGRIYRAKSTKGEETIQICGLLRYGYEDLGWDSGLTDSEDLVDAVYKLIDAKDEETRKIRMMEIIMIAQVQLSSSLLSPSSKSSSSPSTKVKK